MTEGRPICSTVLVGWDVKSIAADADAQGVRVEDSGEIGVLPLTPGALAKLVAALGHDDWKGQKVDVEIRIYREGEGP